MSNKIYRSDQDIFNKSLTDDEICQPETDPDEYTQLMHYCGVGTVTDIPRKLVIDAGNCRTEADFDRFKQLMRRCEMTGYNMMFEWDNQNMLTAAASNGNHMALDCLVRIMGINPNSKTELGLTPLMCIASGLDENGGWNEHYDKCINILFDNGANVNEQTNGGKTALYQAILWGQLEYAKILLDRGAHINEKNKLGRTLLHYICHLSYIDPRSQSVPEFMKYVAILLEKGADPNIQNNNGNTPFMLACQTSNPNLKFVGMLLEKVYVDTNDPSVEKAIALNISCLRTLVDDYWKDTNRNLTESDVEEYDKLKAYLEPLDMTKWVAPGCDGESSQNE